MCIRDRIETGDVIILEKSSTKSIAFITSIGAGDGARIVLSGRAPSTAGQTSTRFCRTVKNEIVGLLRQSGGAGDAQTIQSALMILIAPVPTP